MVQRKEDKVKVNIRKAVMYKAREQKGRYKRLTGEALDSNYNDSQLIREQEAEAWNKFKFYSNLQTALDNVGRKKDN